MHVKPLLSRDHGVTLAQLAVALDIAADHIHHAVNPPYGVGIPRDIKQSRTIFTAIFSLVSIINPLKV